MITDLKSSARTAAFAARKQAHAHAAAVTPTATAHLLAAIGEVAPNHVVSAYMPIRTEIDVLPAMIQLVERGVSVCVPVIQKEANQPLVFRRWWPDVEMVDGPFGAKVPATGAYYTPDILIVPLLAFDAQLNRLGYGGGFYDRTLQHYRDRDPRYTSRLRPPTRAIGFAYAGQQVDAIPQEPTDEPVDLIVTENGALAAPPVQA